MSTFTAPNQRIEVVYGCDTCNRKLRFPSTPSTLDVIRKCIITNGCDGNMYMIRGGADKLAARTRPPEIAGLTDWIPKRLVFNYEQRFSGRVWTIQHNLETRPAVYAYANVNVDGKVQQQAIEPDRVDVIDQNTIELHFSQPYSGIVQCVSLFGQNYVNPETDSTIDQSLYIQLTNRGELTIGTLDAEEYLSFNTVWSSPNVTTPVRITYPLIDNTPSVLSPWVTSRVVAINGKRITVRSFNILNTPNGPTAFDAGQIGNGSTVEFEGLPRSLITNVLLLGQAPFGSVDRISNQCVDLALASSSDLVYDRGELFILRSSRAVRDVYPFIVGAS